MLFGNSFAYAHPLNQDKVHEYYLFELQSISISLYAYEYNNYTYYIVPLRVQSTTLYGKERKKIEEVKTMSKRTVI